MVDNLRRNEEIRLKYNLIIKIEKNVYKWFADHLYTVHKNEDKRVWKINLENNNTLTPIGHKTSQFPVSCD